MRMVCLGVLLMAQGVAAFGAGVASAQTLPDAKALLEREATALDAFSTYRFEEVSTMTVTVAGMPVTVESTTSTAAVNPGKRRMATKMAGMDMQLMVMNGKDIWMFVPIVNQYMHVNADSAEAAAIAGTGVGGIPLGEIVKALGSAGASARVLRSEKITIDGASHDCWVVESRSEQLGVPGMEFRNALTTSWLDQSTGLTLRRTMTATLAEGALPVSGEMKMESNRRGFAFNEPIADSLFIFTPPAGATELNLGGIAGLPGLSPAAPAPVGPATADAPRRKSAAPIPANEPQAFVPQLHPIEHIEPVWPADVRRDGGRAWVELVVTIDEQGSVTGAEALNGPQALRPVAIATVKRMQFRPVIREGRAVAAYTTQTVDFTDWSKPVIEIASVTDDLVAAQRTMTLSQAWPRAKAQVLADYENDLVGAEPALREAFLPQLAKAALEAGEIDKAERYAYDVMGSTSGGSDDGTAMHDGHLVLGRVAMARKEIDLARVHLLEAGKTSGGPVLNSFGPDLTLAQELLDAGQHATVLEYLAQCERFWESGRAQLKKWEAAIRAGERPRLNSLTVLQDGLLAPPAAVASPAVDQFIAVPTR